MHPLLVDSHCHLNMLEFDKLGGDLDHVMAQARRAGVGYMLCVSVDLPSLPQVLASAEHYPHVYASVGVHPNSREGEEPTVERLVSLAEHPKVVAIGETGLDYFRSEGDLEWQRERFRRHIAAAKGCGKPLIVHCRDAKDDTLRILREENAASVGGVMHCFVEDWQTAQACLALNFYISLSGIVTFKTAETLREVARRLPLDRILVETDAPYLAPVPYRGKTNQPAYVAQVAAQIAALRGQPVAELAQASTENFFRLFGHARPMSAA
jgi:TatD DNase family protein